MIGKETRITLSRKDLDQIEKNLNRPRPPRIITPEERRRRDFLREQRRDAGPAFFGIVCVIFAAIGIAWGLIAYFEGKL